MKVLVYDSQYRYLYDEVEAETGKAMLIGGVWLPKSQMKEMEPLAYVVPEWLVDRNIVHFHTESRPNMRRARVIEILEEIRGNIRKDHQEELEVWAKRSKEVLDEYFGV